LLTDGLVRSRRWICCRPVATRGSTIEVCWASSTELLVEALCEWKQLFVLGRRDGEWRSHVGVGVVVVVVLVVVVVVVVVVEVAVDVATAVVVIIVVVTVDIVNIICVVSAVAYARRPSTIIDILTRRRWC